MKSYLNKMSYIGEPRFSLWEPESLDLSDVPFPHGPTPYELAVLRGQAVRAREHGRCEGFVVGFLSAIPIAVAVFLFLTGKF